MSNARDPRDVRTTEAQAHRGTLLTAHVADTAALRAKGSYIVLRIIYRCPSTTGFAGVDVTVSENLGDERMATAFAFASTAADQIICDGERHVLRLAVAPDEFAFKKGEAHVEASFDACSEDCEFFNVSKDVQIVKP